MNRFIPFTLSFLVLAACEDAPDGQASDPASDAVETQAEPMAADADATAAEGPLLDPNEAARAELLEVPGIEPAVADAILAGRPYDDMTAVEEVLAEHLGEEEREAVYARLWKPLDLNNASAEEILLIPGVGERMLHEFEEYRPYRGIEEFRREIGKYVDQERVGFWERYVELR